MLWGVRGLLNVRRSSGVCQGGRVALAGLTTGLVGASLAVTSLVLAVQRVREAAERVH